MTDFERVTYLDNDKLRQMVARYLGTAQGNRITYSLRPDGGTVTLMSRDILSREDNHPGPIALPSLVEPWVTVARAAILLGVTDTRVRQLVKAGKLTGMSSAEDSRHYVSRLSIHDRWLLMDRPEYGSHRSQYRPD